MVEQTSVYKYFDANGVLIYVGITSAGLERNRQHNSSKEWWPFVSSQDVEHFDARSNALIREEGLIKKHCPPFNTQHNPQQDEIKAAYLALVNLPPVSDIAQWLNKQRKRIDLKPHLLDESKQLAVWMSSARDYPVALAFAAPKVRPVVLYQGQGVGQVIECVQVGPFIRITAVLGRAVFSRAGTRPVAVIGLVGLKPPFKCTIKRIHLEPEGVM